MTAIPPGPDRRCSCSTPPSTLPTLHLVHNVPTCYVCKCVMCTCVWMGQLVLARVGVEATSKDTDKGKYLRRQVGAGTHFSPLDILTVIKLR